MDVHVGKDGWLFLSGGSNEVIKYYMEEDFFEVAVGYWIELIRARQKKAKERGVVYRHMIVPDKLSIYPEFFGEILTYPDGSPSVAMKRIFAEQDDSRELTSALIDVRYHMSLAKNKGSPLYWKTDAHWTFEGCWTAYLALCQSVNASLNFAILDAPTTTGELFLDLGSKLEPPVSEPYIVKHFIKGAERVYVNEIVAYKDRENAHDVPGLHVGSHIVLRNTLTSTDSRTIVIFGDSYSEYRLHQLTGLLGETFERTHFVWNSSIDWSYVEKVGADIVVTEMAERFHNLVPDDRLDIDHFAADRMKRHLTE